MENYVDVLEENVVLKVCIEEGVETRFINALYKYLSRNKKCKDFVWMNEEELMCIPGIGIIGAKKLKNVQYKVLCTKCI